MFQLAINGINIFLSKEKSEQVERCKSQNYEKSQINDESGTRVRIKAPLLSSRSGHVAELEVSFRTKFSVCDHVTPSKLHGGEPVFKLNPPRPLFTQSNEFLNCHPKSDESDGLVVHSTTDVFI